MTAAQESIARAQLPLLLAGSSLQASDVALLVIPTSVATLSAPSVERRERFRESVMTAVTAAKTLSAEIRDYPAEEPEHAAVRSAACGICRGACCRYGGDTAYIDEGVAHRVRALHAGLDDAALIEMFMNAIPDRTVEGSCILHGESGCSLPREHRSHVCNDFYCRPIRNWERDNARSSPHPVAVFALHEEKVVRSTLVDQDGDPPDGLPPSRE